MGLALHGVSRASPPFSGDKRQGGEREGVHLGPGSGWVVWSTLPGSGKASPKVGLTIHTTDNGNLGTACSVDVLTLSCFRD